MDFSIATLLSNFTDDKLIAPKALEKKLNCEGENAEQLNVALEALEAVGVLVKERGRYKRQHQENWIEGRLRCSSKGFCFAIQDSEDSEDIYVRESQLSSAWNGDRVLVNVTKEASRRRSPEGEVVLILERASSSVLARVKQFEEDIYRALPLDDRLLFELDLFEKEPDPTEAVEHLVNVEIVRYPIGKHRPIGRIVKVLGLDAEASSDIDIVCCKHSLPRKFPDSLKAAIKALPTKVRKTDMKKRLDWRDHLTVAVHGYGDRPNDTAADSPKAQIDSAISLQQTEAGHWQVGLHFADVAYYVPPDSPIDQEAQRRGVSVYLGDLILPMLPEPLFGSLCSLEPGQDRLTLSLLLTLDEAGEIIEFELQPTVIQVDYLLSYQQAEKVINRAEKGDIESDIEEFTSAFELLDQLFKISQSLAEKRHQRGAFELNLPDKLLQVSAAPKATEPDSNEEADSATESEQESTDKGTEPKAAESNQESATEDHQDDVFTKFHYDDEGALGATVVSSFLPARSMLLEFMLVANQLVADHLRELELPGIYRVHRPPHPADVVELSKLAGNIGIELQLEDEENVHSQDYRNFTQKFAESKAERVLTYLLLSTLKPATYTTEPGLHFGLALENGYTHFSAPVRRYPDLLVQRVLHAVFEEGRDRRSTRAKDRVNLRHSSCHGNVSWNVLPPELHSELMHQISTAVIHLSEREKLAQEAEADLEGLRKAEFMKAHTGELFHGLITGVQSYGFFVEIEELLVEGLVHVSSLKDDWYEYRSRQQKLVGRKNRQQYRLGDRVEVEVKSVDYYRQQIDLVVLGGGSESDDDDDETNGYDPEAEYEEELDVVDDGDDLSDDDDSDDDDYIDENDDEDGEDVDDED